MIIAFYIKKQKDINKQLEKHIFCYNLILMKKIAPKFKFSFSIMQINGK